jgi:DNA-binding IclR family transcriptional regulator
MRISLFAGAGAKLVLPHLPDEEIDDRIVPKCKLNKFTLVSCTNKQQYKETIRKARQEPFV